MQTSKKFLKITSVMIALCMVSTSAIMGVSAAESENTEVSATVQTENSSVSATIYDYGKVGKVVKTGVCGKNVEYTLYEEGLLLIDGYGSMNKYNKITNLPPWYAERNNIKEVLIGNQIVSIGAASFYNCTEIEKVTLGSSVRTIDDSAFFQCSKLEEVVIPDTVTNIHNGADENTITAVLRAMKNA